jgi:hypothetical protein
MAGGTNLAFEKDIAYVIVDGPYRTLIPSARPHFSWPVPLGQVIK